MFSYRCFVNVWVDIHMKKIIIPSCLCGVFSVSYASHSSLTENMLSGSYQKPPLAHQEEQTTTRLVGWYGVRGLDGGPTFQNSSESDPLIIITAKWNIAIVWLFRTGQTNEKAHTGESRLKWEAKDSSKLIGNKDHALRGLSSPMVGIRQIRLIT